MDDVDAALATPEESAADDTDAGDGTDDELHEPDDVAPGGDGAGARDGSAPGGNDDSAAGDVGAPSIPTPKVDAGPMPKLPRPPRVKFDPPPPKGAKKERWQDKYKGEQENREKACAFFTDKWVAGLKYLAAEIAASGAQPMVDPDVLRPAIMLTVDAYMPDIDIKPEHEAAIGTSLLLGQRFARRKEIAAMKKQAAKETEQERFVREQKERVERARAESEAKSAEAAAGIRTPPGFADGGSFDVRKPDEPELAPVRVPDETPPEAPNGARKLSRAEMEKRAEGIVV